MLKKTISYTDYDGNERTEDFYFNLTEPELIEMEMTTVGGLEKTLNDIIAKQNSAGMIGLFKKILLASYGEKTLDGKRFVKSDEATTAFSQTPAYTKLYIEMLSDPSKFEEFVRAVVPNVEDRRTAIPQDAGK